MTKEELNELIEACKQRHLYSQKKLYQHFYSYGMTVCMRYARDREEAKEIFNDGFLKVFAKLNQYTPSLSFKAWINRILVNTAIDHYRKYQNKPRTVDIVHAQHFEASSSVLEDLSAQDVLKLVQQLSPAYRVVFSLYVVEGYKHHEIAKKLGISEGTSKSNLAKAKAKLKAMLYKRNEKTNRYG